MIWFTGVCITVVERQTQVAFLSIKGFVVWMVGNVLYGICKLDYQKVRRLQPERLLGPRGVLMTGLVFLSISVVGWLLMGTVPNFHGIGFRVMHGVNAGLFLGGYHLS